MKEHLISWSPVAEETYLKTLSQILERWTIKEAEVSICIEKSDHPQANRRSFSIG